MHKHVRFGNISLAPIWSIYYSSFVELDIFSTNGFIYGLLKIYHSKKYQSYTIEIDYPYPICFQLQTKKINQAQNIHTSFKQAILP